MTTYENGVHHAAPNPHDAKQSTPHDPAASLSQAWGGQRLCQPSPPACRPVLNDGGRARSSLHYGRHHCLTGLVPHPRVSLICFDGIVVPGMPQGGTVLEGSCGVIFLKIWPCGPDRPPATSMGGSQNPLVPGSTEACRGHGREQARRRITRRRERALRPLGQGKFRPAFSG
jgi:hypothetical protein